jgi:hypothetical protein
MIIHFYRRFHLFRPVLRIGPRTLHPVAFEKNREYLRQEVRQAHQDTLHNIRQAHQDNLQNIRQVHQETLEEMRQAMRQSEGTRLQRPNLETPFGEDAALYLPQ